MMKETRDIAGILHDFAQYEQRHSACVGGLELYKAEVLSPEGFQTRHEMQCRSCASTVLAVVQPDDLPQLLARFGHYGRTR
jgi:hypothetical protein